MCNVEVWRFAARATDAERYGDRLPVRIGNKLMGEIELATVFDSQADPDVP